MSRVLRRIQARLWLHLHNLAYKKSGDYAVMLEGGLHPKHRLVNYRRFFLNNINSGDRILDVGCGNGFLTWHLSRKAKQVVGIDVSARNIEVARRKYRADNIEYRVADATRDLPGERFDVVVLSSVLEHIEKRPEFLAKIRGLAPKFLIRVPMVNRDWITLYKKEQGIEWRTDPGHHTEYTLESFTGEMAAAGLQIRSATIQFGELWAVVTL